MWVDFLRFPRNHNRQAKLYLPWTSIDAFQFKTLENEVHDLGDYII